MDADLFLLSGPSCAWQQQGGCHA